MKAASTGAPCVIPGWPAIPKSDICTVSGIVFTSAPRLLYTVIVCVYIMFCANTSPVFDDATDFGEMWPEIVVSSDSRR